MPRQPLPNHYVLIIICAKSHSIPQNTNDVIKFREIVEFEVLTQVSM